jgi:hypothetical protein
LLKASKSETIEYRRRKGPNDDVEIIIQITKQEEDLMPFVLNRFFTCSKLRALSSSASVVFLRDTLGAWVVQRQSQCSYQKAFEQYYKLGKGTARCSVHILHLTRPYKRRSLSF